MSSQEEKYLNQTDCDNCGTVEDLESELETAEEKIGELEDTITVLQDKLKDGYKYLDKAIDDLKEVLRSIEE